MDVSCSDLKITGHESTDFPALDHLTYKPVRATLHYLCQMINLLVLMG